MPIYEYYCKECNKVFEIMKAMKDRDSVIICPVCGKETTKKLSTYALIFKGSGFYTTDYKNKKKG